MSKANRDKTIATAFAKGQHSRVYKSAINPYRKEPYKTAWERGRRTVSPGPLTKAV